MSQIHLEKKSNTKWALLAGAVVAVGAAAVWWSRSNPSAEAQRVTEAQPVAAPQASAAEPAMPSVPMTAEQIQSEAKVLADRQQEAAKALAQNPYMKPLTGPITERPEFVSALEWQMLKGASQQAGNPDEELTRMVNFLRFNKQIELLDSLAQSPDKAKRQALAEQLLPELPTRMKNSEMDLKEAKRILGDLVRDAVPDDAQARARRMDAESHKLDQLAAQLAAEEKAKGH